MATTQFSFAQRGQLAQQTRERFVADAGRAMAELGGLVQERLTALMDEAAPSREMQNRRDAWTFYQRTRAAWLEGTLKAWQAALQPPAVKEKPGLQDGGGLELVGREVVEDKILASRLVLGVMEKVSGQLDDLRLRIKFLEGSEALDDHDILRPEVLILLMVEQWAGAGMPRDAWSMVNDVVHRFLIERLKTVYANCNDFLIRQGVMPTIELKDRVKRAPPAAGAHPRPAKAPAPEGAGGADSQSPGDTGGEGGPGGAHEEARRMTPSAPPRASTGSQAQGVMGRLKRLLGNRGGSDFGATSHQPASPALAAAMAYRPDRAVSYGDGTVLEDHSPAGLARVAGELREQTAALKKKAETKSEKATIEIVALMFQAILTEDRIPPGIRVWFARLQMPVLRVALAEPEFFGTLNHPARQLIDRMGSCVMGFDASTVNGGALEAEIRRMVQLIEQYPETGRRVFQIAYEEFQKFLAKFLTGKKSTRKVVSVAQQVEQKETLSVQYTIEMRNMLKDMPVRDEIRTFLFKVWAEVLAVAAVRKGPQHPETVALKKSASDLVWSASAKPSRSDRARVIEDLPQLLQRLRSGMTLLGLSPADQEVHIKTVSDTLADAFLSKTQAIPQAQIEAMARRLANLEDFVSEDGMGDLPLDAESIEMMLGIDASSIDVVADGGSRPGAAMLAWAQELEPGSWFTLDHNGRVNQVQFAWRSERKHLNLFASTDGHSYLIQTGRLAAYLQAGLLLPQEEETLTVRATRDALTKIEANPERLLA